MPESEKKLHGVIEVSLGDSFDRSIRQVEERFRALEGRALPGGAQAQAREQAETANKIVQSYKAVQKLHAEFGNNVTNWALETEKVRQNTVRVAKALEDESVKARSVLDIVEDIHSVQAELRDELGLMANADKDRVTFLRAQERFQVAQLVRSRQITSDQEKTVTKQRDEFYRMNRLQEQAIRQREREQQETERALARQRNEFYRMNRLQEQAIRQREREQQEEVKKLRAAITAEFRMRKYHAQALNQLKRQEEQSEVRRRREQEQAERKRVRDMENYYRMNRLHEQAIRQRQREREQTETPILGIMATTFSRASSALGKMLRVYWIILSIIYLVRNIWQGITGIVQGIEQTLRGIVSLLSRFVGLIVNAAAEMETLDARMRVMFREHAPGVMRWIMGEAVGLPFTWVDIGEAMTRAMVMGAKSFAQGREILRVAEDMAVAFGQPLERAVHAIMQGAAGHFRSLIETFGFRPEMAVRFGAVRAVTGQGIAGSPEYYQQNLAAIMAMVSSRVGGAAQAMRGTWKALVEDLKDMLYRIVYDIRDVVVDPLRVILTALREMFIKEGELAPWVKDVLDSFRKVWTLLAGGAARALLERLPMLIAIMVGTMKWLADRFTKWFESLGGIEGILERIEKALLTWMPSILTSIARALDLLSYLPSLVGLLVRLRLIASEAELGRRSFREQREELRKLGWDIQEARVAGANTALEMASWGYKLHLHRPRGLPPASEQERVRAQQILEDIERTARESWIRRREIWSHGFPGAREAQKQAREAAEKLRDIARNIGVLNRVEREKVEQGRQGGLWVAIASAVSEEWGKRILEAQQHVGRGLTWQEVEALMPDPRKLTSAMEDGADYAADRIEEGFENGARRIESIFDVGRFMGYTAMAIRHGYGGIEAMQMAQQRVIQEMNVAAGQAGAYVYPWPWQTLPPAPQQYTRYFAWSPWGSDPWHTRNPRNIAQLRRGLAEAHRAVEAARARRQYLSSLPHLVEPSLSPSVPPEGYWAALATLGSRIGTAISGAVGTYVQITIKDATRDGIDAEAHGAHGVTSYTVRRARRRG